MRCGEEEELNNGPLGQEEQVSANCIGGETETSTSGSSHSPHGEWGI